MRATETTLDRLLAQPRQLLVPLFQRPYCWTIDHWRRLWRDLVETLEADGTAAHFLGAIVVKPAGATAAGTPRAVLIDGQQRLVTLSILIAALRDLIRRDDPERARQIDARLLADPAAGPGAYRVLPTHLDRADYARVIAEPGRAAPSRFRDAYAFFAEAIVTDRLDDGRRVDPRRLEQLIRDRIEIVEVTLEEADNEHRIFEGLNATGARLTQADLLRNYFFLRLPETDHERAYADLWLPMQERLGTDRLDAFVRYALLSEGEFVRQADVYAAWRKRLDGLDPTALHDRLAQFVRDAGFYHRLTDPAAEPDPELARGFERLRRWGNQTVYPFLIDVYRRHAAGLVTAAEFAEALRIVESYLVRRTICDEGHRSLARFFVQLTRPIPEGADLVRGLRAYLAAPGRGWPTDEEFRAALLRAPIGLLRPDDRRRCLLESLIEAAEGRLGAAAADLDLHWILPGLAGWLTDDWIQLLGPEAAAIRDRYAQRLGNLTLAPASLDLRYGSFAQKQAELARSPFATNQAIARATRWTPAEIEDRGRDLADLALKVWPGP